MEDRAAARLLVLPRLGGPCEHRSFRDLPALLAPGDLLVLNNTRVSALRLTGHKTTGGAVELLLLRETEESGVYEALVKPGRRLKPGSEVVVGRRLRAFVLDSLGEGLRSVRLECEEDLESALAECGRVPLPPYIRREIEVPERYQTVYASVRGSAAAPTAGLHFTPEVFDALAERGVQVAWVTLDVSLDTFRPVSSDNLDEVSMHGERCVVPEETAVAIERCTGRVVAVGTTSARTLETFATGHRSVEAGERVSRLFVRPGYRFQVVDALLTNFHLPRTTMLLMVSALCGRERLLAAYGAALERGYRFLSFGDAMLVL